MDCLSARNASLLPALPTPSATPDGPRGPFRLLQVRAARGGGRHLGALLHLEGCPPAQLALWSLVRPPHLARLPACWPTPLQVPPKPRSRGPADMSSVYIFNGLEDGGGERGKSTMIMQVPPGSAHAHTVGAVRTRPGSHTRRTCRRLSPPLPARPSAISLSCKSARADALWTRCCGAIGI